MLFNVYGELEMEERIKQDKLQCVGAQPRFLSIYNRMQKQWRMNKANDRKNICHYPPYAVHRCWVTWSADKLLCTCILILQQTLWVRLWAWHVLIIGNSNSAWGFALLSDLDKSHEEEEGKNCSLGVDWEEWLYCVLSSDNSTSWCSVFPLLMQHRWDVSVNHRNSKDNHVSAQVLT
jgi:hypothetical protein